MHVDVAVVDGLRDTNRLCLLVWFVSLCHSHVYQSVDGRFNAPKKKTQLQSAHSQIPGIEMVYESSSLPGTSINSTYR